MAKQTTKDKRRTRLRVRANQHWTLLRFKLARWRSRNAAMLEGVIWATLVVICLGLFRNLQVALAGLLDKNGADDVRDFIGGVGLAMVGATAIAASFILFALQVNVERLPPGLFRKFSTDARLLWSVAASLLLAIGGTALSLVTDDHYLALASLGGLLCLALILRLLLYAYQRSLRLIDPGEQIGLLARQSSATLERWRRQVEMMASLVELPDKDRPSLDETRTDYQRLTVLQANPQWIRPVKAVVGQMTSFAQRAGVSGDQEVSALALTRLLEVNHHYIVVKGRTFFANNLIFDNPLVTDDVINDTLENLKQLSQAALARRDERQLAQIFSTMGGLIRIYASIDYGSRIDNKSHAHLAARYLADLVQQIMPTGMTDTTMVGVRELGRAARVIVRDARATEAVELIKQIGLMGSAGILKPTERPIALVAVQELRDVTLHLLGVQDDDPGFAIQQMRQVLGSLVQLVLATPDQPLVSGHSFYLRPYYSLTNAESFAGQLAQLTNALFEEGVDQAAAKHVVRNLAKWSDGLYQGQKEILLLAAEKRSQLFFDVMHWITAVSEILLAAAASPAASEHLHNELRHNALWLVSTLGWIPTDKESAQFVENSSHLDNLTEFALKVRQRDELECYDAAQKMMFDWALKAGGHHTGWGTLARWLAAIVGLNVTAQPYDGGAALKAKLTAALLAPDAPSQEHRDRAACELLDTAEEVREREFDTNIARRLLASGDRAVMRQLLQELAEILSPGSTEKHADSPSTFF